jgi:hypothetical protein
MVKEVVSRVILGSLFYFQNCWVMKFFFVLWSSFSLWFTASAQNNYALNTGWQCKRADSLHASGEVLSTRSFTLIDWMPATVPGTVLTTLLDNKKIPDPFEETTIPDIFRTGRDYYTYWFVRDFSELTRRWRSGLAEIQRY